MDTLALARHPENRFSYASWPWEGISQPTGTEMTTSAGLARWFE